MSTVRHLLPRLTLNRRLLQAVVDQRVPCAALGVVEERQQRYSLIAIGLPDLQNLDTLGDGFRLGNQALAGAGVVALRLTFEFEGQPALHLLLDPFEPPVPQVLETLSKGASFLVLVVGACGVATFRDEGQGQAWQSAQTWQDRPRGTLGQPGFDQARATFERRQPAGEHLAWVGRGDSGLLDLDNGDRHELRPRP